jgi:hypothetical protein
MSTNISKRESHDTVVTGDPIREDSFELTPSRSTPTVRCARRADVMWLLLVHQYFVGLFLLPLSLSVRITVVKLRPVPYVLMGRLVAALVVFGTGALVAQLVGPQPSGLAG